MLLHIDYIILRDFKPTWGSMISSLLMVDDGLPVIIVAKDVHHIFHLPVDVDEGPEESEGDADVDMGDPGQGDHKQEVILFDENIVDLWWCSVVTGDVIS